MFEYSLTVAAGIFVIILIVLLGPLLIKKMEHNLEVFLFSMGIVAVTINSVFLKASSNPGTDAGEAMPGWNFMQFKTVGGSTGNGYVTAWCTYSLNAGFRKPVQVFPILISLVFYLNFAQRG